MDLNISFRNIVGIVILSYIFFVVLLMSIMNSDPFIYFILFLIIISIIIYSLKLNNYTNYVKKRITEFNIVNCPNSYNKSTTNNGNTIICKNKKTNKTFYLDGMRDTECNINNINLMTTNGCFNIYPDRKMKCDKIEKYFKGSTVLTEWADYIENCA